MNSSGLKFYALLMNVLAAGFFSNLGAVWVERGASPTGTGAVVAFFMLMFGLANSMGLYVTLSEEGCK